MTAPRCQLINDDRTFCPTFEKQLIEEHRKDGYWLETFQPDAQTPVGLLAFGLGEGEINYYPNPCATTEKAEPILIQKLITPVALTTFDVTRNGFNDIIICHDYGNTILDFNPDGGLIYWLENPGHNMGKEQWKRYYVGRSATMHRLKVGYFTQNKRVEIIGLPVVHGPFDVPIPVFCFRQPDDLLNAKEWDRELINGDYFHLIHDAAIFTVNSLHHLLLASREGLNWVYYNTNSKQWIIEKISDGEQEERRQTNYYGSAGAAIGKIGNDTCAYICAVEPFHGNVLSIYTKISKNNSLKEIEWERRVLDVYGRPDEHGESPGHFLACADFDQDGDDEFLLALRGPSPNQGVYYYKAIDLAHGVFLKRKVSEESAARIAVADFNYDGLLDFATIGYSVRGYYVAENPSINIYYNRFAKKLQHTNPLQVMKQDNELLFNILRPYQIQQYAGMPFITIGGITVSLDIIPPRSSLYVSKNYYVKVLYGSVSWTDSRTKESPKSMSRSFLCQPKSVSSLEVHSSDSRIKTGNEGAIVIVFKMPANMDGVPQFDSIEKVTIENSLPESCSESARNLGFTFVKWDEKAKDLEFYNMKGFTIKFADNNETLCHIQLWAAGKGTNCGVHNHSTNQFCEVHACIVNGTGKGGMHYLNSSKEVYDPATTPDSKFEKLVVPSFYEHGPLWDIDEKKQPVLRKDGTVVYPWHKWQSGTDGSSVQSYDVWMAFEFNNRLSTLPN